MTELPRRGVLRDLTRAVVLLMTVGGGYWGAKAIDEETAFWVLIGLASAYAILVVPCWRFSVKKAREIRELVDKGRQHDRVLEVAARHQARVEDLEGQLSWATSHAELDYARGIVEGRRRAVGEAMANTTSCLLKPRAMGVRDDELLIAATCDEGAEIEIDSHWLLRVRGVGTNQAILTVADRSENEVVLKVDRAINESFVSNLTNNARTTSEFPKSLEVLVRPMASIRDLSEEI